MTRRRSVTSIAVLLVTLAAGFGLGVRGRQDDAPSPGDPKTSSPSGDREPDSRASSPTPPAKEFAASPESGPSHATAPSSGDTLSGRVIQANGSPQAGVSVTLTRFETRRRTSIGKFFGSKTVEERHSVKTNADGRFSVDGVANAYYRVGTPGRDSEVWVDGRETAFATPHSEVRVKLASQGNRGRITITTSHESPRGRLRFIGSDRHRGERFPPQTFDVPLDASHAQLEIRGFRPHLVAIPPELPATVSPRLEPVSSLTIHWSDDLPAGGRWVLWYSQIEDETATDDALRNFALEESIRGRSTRLEDLPRGRYAIALAERNTRSILWKSTVELDIAERVVLAELPPLESSSTLDVRFEVEDPTEALRKDDARFAFVDLARGRWSVVDEVWTSDRTARLPLAESRIEDWTPGRYSLRVSINDRIIEVPLDTRPAVVRLRARARVTVTTRGFPDPTGLHVRAESRSHGVGSERRTRASEPLVDGSATLRVEPGEYELEVDAGSFAVRQSVSIPAGGTSVELVAPAADQRLTLRFSEVPGYVTLYALDAGNPSQQSLEGQPEVTFESLPAGSYLVVAERGPSTTSMMVRVDRSQAVEFRPEPWAGLELRTDPPAGLGLERGDRWVSLEGVPVRGHATLLGAHRELVSMVWKDESRVTVERDGRTLEIALPSDYLTNAIVHWHEGWVPIVEER